MKILAVDYGDSRTGLATCDRTEFLTSPITPQITVKARDKVAARVWPISVTPDADKIPDFSIYSGSSAILSVLRSSSVPCC